MGLTNAMLSRAKGDKHGPEPSLLSQSEADYRQSLALFEKLHAEFPTDPKVRRFYAEALGSWGWGWLLMATNRTDEAKPNYERAVQLLREQIRDASASDHGGADNRAKEGVTNVLSDLTSLASTVYALAGILEVSGLAQEAGDLRRQLDDDINVLAARFSESGPPAVLGIAVHVRRYFVIETEQLSECGSRFPARDDFETGRC